MRLIFTKTLFSALIAGAASLVSMASHAGLDGRSVTATWEYAPTDYVSTRSFTVGAGVELLGNFGVGSTLDVGDDYFRVIPDASLASYSEGVTWTFSDLDFGSPFTVAVSTTGVENPQAGHLQVGATSFSWTASREVMLLEGPQGSASILFQVQAVPEPGSALLMLAGGALLLCRYRGKRVGAAVRPA